MARAHAAVRDLLEVVSEPGRGGGELSALVSLLATLDVGHAAAVALTDQALRRNAAQRSAGLSFEGLLSISTRATYRDRGLLVRTAQTLRSMPNLRAAWHRGILGWGQVCQVMDQARRLTAEQRAALDTTFADPERYAGWDADRLVDATGDAATRLRPDAERGRELRRIEQRFHHVQPQLDGGVTGYYELDPEAGAVWLEALQAASPAPTGTRDATRDAIDHHPDDPDASLGDDAEPSFLDAVPGRTRARQRADGMVTLAESWLAGTRTDGTPRRARPRMWVWTDIATLGGEGRAAASARLLWATHGGPAHLTDDAVRRIASDADLQFILHHEGQILGVSEPTATIPAKVRAAVHARDMGCRFPGCRAPIHWTDLHHVTAREDGGPTTVDNLVALCRRHHTAITTRAWTLAMTVDGTVTVTRGSRTAISHPPHRTVLEPPGNDPPSGQGDGARTARTRRSTPRPRTRAARAVRDP